MSSLAAILGTTAPQPELSIVPARRNEVCAPAVVRGALGGVLRR